MNENYSSLIQKHIDILSLRDLSESTIANYTAYLREFFEWAEEQLGGKDPSGISLDELHAYIRHLQVDRKLNNRTINCHIAQLRDFWAYVLQKDFSRYQLPFLKYDQYLPKVPTREEMTSIISHLENPKHKAEIALLYSSGLRVSELCRLHCGDIRASKKCIYVQGARTGPTAMPSSPKEPIRTWCVMSGLILKEPRRMTGCFPGRRPENISVPSPLPMS